MSRRELSRPRAVLTGYAFALSRPTLAFGRPTLADRFFERSLLSDVVLVFAGAALTAILAHATIPLWPAPVTGQTLGVLLVGGSLGAVRAALSMILYLVLAVSGLPVLPGGAGGIEPFMTPTAGYFYGFVVAAAFVGWLAQRSWDRRVLRVFLSFLAGGVIALLFGALWHAFAPGGSITEALYRGVSALLPEVVLKPVLVTSIIAFGWRVVDTEDRRRATDDLTARE